MGRALIISKDKLGHGSVRRHLFTFLVGCGFRMVFSGTGLIGPPRGPGRHHISAAICANSAASARRYRYALRMTTLAMTRDQIEAAARAIGGDGHGWRVKASKKLGFSERTLRDAINAGRWSADFEARIVSIIASDHVRVGAVTSAEAGIRADLIEIAGGETAGWQQRAADAARLSVSTIKGAIQGKASEKTKAKIRETLINAATAGGVKPLGRQVGDWVVGMPEGRMPERSGIIAEAVIIHTTQPVVIVHIAHRAGPMGSAPRTEVRTRWIEEASNRGEARDLLDVAITKGQDFITHQLRAISSFKARSEAADRARMIGSIGDDEDLLGRSSHRELLVSGTIERNGDTHTMLRDQMSEEISSINEKIKATKDAITSSLDDKINGLMNVLEDLAEQKGKAVMLREYAKNTIETGDYASPAAAVLADYLFRQAVLDGREARAVALLEETLGIAIPDETIDGQALQRLIETRSWAIEHALSEVAKELGGMVVNRRMIWINEAQAEHSERFHDAFVRFGLFYVVRAPVVWAEMTLAQLKVIIRDHWDRTADPDWEAKIT